MAKIDPSVPVGLLARTQQEADLFVTALAECKFRRITVFLSAKEAYEVVTRQQFSLFVTRMEMTDMPGLVFVQKIRDTGNYGSEAHLFACDKLEPGTANLLYEMDIPYVLVKPFTKDTIKAKFKHLVDTENALTPRELQYRDALAAFRGGLDDMALEMTQAILKDAPAFDKALVLLGDLQMRKEQFLEAQKSFVAAMKVNPKFASAAHKLAQTYMKLNDHARAADILDKLAAINPHHIKILENAGLSSLGAERFDDAKRHAAKLATVDEGNKTAAVVTVEVKIHEGDYAGVVDALKKSHSEKEIVQFLNNAGVKLSKGNDVDGALKMYKAAAEALGDKSQYAYAIYYNIGIAYKRQKAKAEARTYFERCLRLKPDFDKARSAMDELLDKSA